MPHYIGKAGIDYAKADENRREIAAIVEESLSIESESDEIIEELETPEYTTVNIDRFLCLKDMFVKHRPAITRHSENLGRYAEHCHEVEDGFIEAMRSMRLKSPNEMR